MDFSIVCEEFYSYSLSIKGYSKATIRRYKYVLQSVSKFTSTEALDQITKEKLQWLFIYGRTQRKWSTHTYRVYFNTLVVFLRWCVKQGYLSASPDIDMELPKAEKRLPVKLTKQDALRVLETVYNYPFPSKFYRCRNHAIFATFIFAGLRKQELLHLRTTDIDLENLTIFVRQGKGAKDRIVPISYTLAHSLSRYNVERNKMRKTCPEFFVSSNRNMGYTDQGLRRLSKQINAACGFKFTIHKLRHTFATLMLEGGCDIYSLSKMMGHSDIKTTTIYLSATAEHLRAQMSKHPLNDALQVR